jgi:tripartite-type tricarboxylate transporter receptor subunit TctC
MALSRIWIKSALVLSLLATPVAAQTWPDRPLTMVNPFAAGGPNDVPARLFAERMGEALGQSVIVENVGGAGGMLGAQKVAHARPDGYTFLLGTVGTQAQNQTLYKHPAYDATKDFASIGLFLEAPLVLVARKSLPVDDMKGLREHAASAHLKFGSAGLGSALHLGCALMNGALGIESAHVPYRGAAPAMQDLIAGNIDYICDIVTTAKPQIEGGAVKALAILSPERSKVLPNVPTAREDGFDVSAYTWNAFFLPAGTPPAIVAKLNEAMVTAMNTPNVRTTLESAGLKLVSPDRATPAYLDQFVRSELAKWAKPIEALGMKIE